MFFFLLPSFWFQATSILMRKKDVEQTKSATIFLDKTIDPWLPYPFHKCTEILLVENEVGQGPMWGRGVDWRWSLDSLCFAVRFPLSLLETNNKDWNP